MAIPRQISRKLWLPIIAVMVVRSVPAHAGVYPTNTCVSRKLGAGAVACQKVLTAWSIWERDPSKDPGNGKLNAAIATAGQRLATAWTTAEQVASRKGIDCAETTATSASISTAIATAASDLVSTINDNNTFDFSNKTGRLCRAKLLQAAAIDCLQSLKAESNFVQSLAKDPGGVKRDAAQARAGAKFSTAWSAAACPTTATETGIAANLSTINDTVVTDATVSPNVPDTWTKITPPAQVQYNRQTLAPMCSDGSQYVYFAKRGTVNKLVVYYYGGGACWDYQTCGPLHPYTRTTGDQDNPVNVNPGGFGNQSNAANPFANWNTVVVPYCTGDVHWGNATATYQDFSIPPKTVTIQHKGFVNAQVVEKWTREHFVNPEVVFVAGSSAGGYGALLNSLYFRQNVYQGSKFYIFDDAGNGVITPAFQSTNLAQWGVQASLPKWIPALNVPIDQLSLSQVAAAAANFYPSASFVQYTTAWDNTQISFYNLMVYGETTKGLQWWLSACDWHNQMRSFALQTAAGASNYRHYIGAGSQHTVWGFDKVYTDTKGGVPLLVDWVNAMLTGSAGWTNVECTDCSLEPGDPNPVAGPFAADGTVTCP